MDSFQNDDQTILSPNEPLDADNFNAGPEKMVDVPSFEPAPGGTPPVSHGEVVTPGQPPVKNNKKTIWIIIGIVLAVLCCCCIVVVVAVNRGMKEMNLDDFQDLLNEFSLLIQIAPAYI